MLRVLVGLLLAANLLFFGWTMGWMDGLLGRGSAPEREPERLARQVNAQRVVLWPTAASASASAASSGTAGVPATGAAAASAPLASPVAPPVVVAAATQAAASTMAQASAARAPTPAGSAAALAGPVASAATGPVPLVCLEAGPFNPAELAAATTALRATVPQGSWVQRAGGTVAGGGEWMIYMGPYPDRDWMERKKRELARIRGGVPQEEITAPPELARGISLGRFPTKAAADAALAQYALRGIRTARVLSTGPGVMPLNYLRVGQANPAVAASLADLKLPPRGAAFKACPR